MFITLMRGLNALTVTLQILNIGWMMGLILLTNVLTVVLISIKKAIFSCTMRI